MGSSTWFGYVSIAFSIVFRQMWIGHVMTVGRGGALGVDVHSLCFPRFCDPVRDNRDPMGPLYAIIGSVRLMGLLE